jgi:hypothetical protein
VCFDLVSTKCFVAPWARRQRGLSDPAFLFDSHVALLPSINRGKAYHNMELDILSFVVGPFPEPLTLMSDRPPQPRKNLVHRFQIELFCLEMTTSPTNKMFVFFVCRIENDLQKFLIT